MDNETEYFLLAMLYFAVFLIAGVLIGHSHGMVVKLPVLGGLMATSFYFWATCLRR
jgi:hypothetical protein